jgi:hypothetical protein
MQITPLTGFLALLACLTFATCGAAAAQDDPFVALVTNAEGSYTYVRRENIEALTDVSPAHCLLSLTSSSKNIRAFQKCSSLLEKLQRHDFVAIPADFGNTYIAPQEIATMAWTGNSRCQIVLRSGKFVYAKQSCNEVHDGLLRE